MAYIGSTPTSQNFTSGTDYFSGTGSQTAFTLTRTVNSVNDIEVVINNVVQQPSTAYTLSGTTITFTSAPSSGTNNIYVRYLATNMQSFTVPANSITRTQLDSNLQAGFQGRNRIINGAMTVAQRGTSSSDPADGQYVLDRWKTSVSATGKLSVEQSATAPAGFVNSLKITSSSAYSSGASAYFVIQQAIEGYNTADLGWGTASAKTITLSFQVYSSLTGTFGGSLQNSAGNRSYPFTYTVGTANTWTTVSVTITGDTSGTWLTTNGVGIWVYFNLGTGTTYSGTAGAWAGANYLSATGATSVVGTSGATFYITGVQLEEGTTATSFERESFSITLQKCQRYYEELITSDSQAMLASGFNYSTNQPQAVVRFAVEKRTTASMGYTVGIAYQAAGQGGRTNMTPLFYISTSKSVMVYTGSASGLTAGAGCNLCNRDDGTGRLFASAEL